MIVSIRLTIKQSLQS